MGTLTIYGASDDLIEFEGDFEDEGNHFSDDAIFIHLNDGSVIEAFYDQDGIWRFNPAKLADGTIVQKHEKGSVEEDTPDRLTLTSANKFKSFRLWEQAEGPSKSEIKDFIEKWFDNRGLRNLSEQSLRKLYNVINEL